MDKIPSTSSACRLVIYLPRISFGRLTENLLYIGFLQPSGKSSDQIFADERGTDGTGQIQKKSGLIGQLRNGDTYDRCHTLLPDIHIEAQIGEIRHGLFHCRRDIKGPSGVQQKG